MSDLFSDRDTTCFDIPDLVERLALEKLQKAAVEFTGLTPILDKRGEGVPKSGVA